MVAAWLRKRAKELEKRGAVPTFGSTRRARKRRTPQEWWEAIGLRWVDCGGKVCKPPWDPHREVWYVDHWAQQPPWKKRYVAKPRPHWKDAVWFASEEVPEELTYTHFRYPEEIVFTKSDAAIAEELTARMKSLKP